MNIMQLLAWMVFGLVVGALAKFVLPGRDPGGLLVTALIGMAGSLIGTFAGQYLFGNGGYQAGWMMSVLGTIVLLLGWRMLAGRRA
ncbi:MAG: GlsB/YeaQ/YmgE family stress response membrane protein [Blastocatellia bacterium]